MDKLRSKIRKIVNQEIMREQENQDKYDQMFTKMLDIFGIEDPGDLPERHRGAFFNMVDLAWAPEGDKVDDEAFKLAKQYVKGHELDVNESTQQVPEAFKRMVKEKVNNGMDKKEAVKEAVKHFMKNQ